jgi:hypothetical protein
MFEIVMRIDDFLIQLVKYCFGMSVKTSRKTIESWSIAAGIPESTVCLRQGHDSATSMHHYQGLAFSDDELNDIRKILTEWRILR